MSLRLRAAALSVVLLLVPAASAQAQTAKQLVTGYALGETFTQTGRDRECDAKRHCAVASFTGTRDGGYEAIDLTFGGDRFAGMRLDGQAYGLDTDLDGAGAGCWKTTPTWAGEPGERFTQNGGHYGKLTRSGGGYQVTWKGTFQAGFQGGVRYKGTATYRFDAARRLTSLKQSGTNGKRTDTLTLSVKYPPSVAHQTPTPLCA